MKKKAETSYTEQYHLLMFPHLNGEGRLFGGQLLSWIDETAGIAGRRFTGLSVVTAAIDNLQFKAGAYQDEIIVLIGKVVYTGHTSFDVRVDTYVERKDGMRYPINRAYLTMVAIDENHCPTPVPQLLIETESQKGEWEAAQKRRMLSKTRRKEGF